MHQSGFKWVLRPDGQKWAWKAVGHDDGAVVIEGVADSRAEAAAYLARAMALGVLAGGEVAAS